MVNDRGYYDEENTEESVCRWVMFYISVLGDSGMNILFITSLLNPSFKFFSFFPDYTSYLITEEFKV